MSADAGGQAGRHGCNGNLLTHIITGLSAHSIRQGCQFLRRLGIIVIDIIQQSTPSPSLSAPLHPLLPNNYSPNGSTSPSPSPLTTSRPLLSRRLRSHSRSTPGRGRSPSYTPISPSGGNKRYTIMQMTERMPTASMGCQGRAGGCVCGAAAGGGGEGCAGHVGAGGVRDWKAGGGVCVAGQVGGLGVRVMVMVLIWRAIISVSAENG